MFRKFWLVGSTDQLPRRTTGKVPAGSVFNLDMFPASTPSFHPTGHFPLPGVSGASTPNTHCSFDGGNHTEQCIRWLRDS